MPWRVDQHVTQALPRPCTLWSCIFRTCGVVHWPNALTQFTQLCRDACGIEPRTKVSQPVRWLTLLPSGGAHFCAR